MSCTQQAYNCLWYPSRVAQDQHVVLWHLDFNLWFYTMHMTHLQLSRFRWIGFIPFKSLQNYSYDKLQVLDLGSVHLFCHMTNDYLRRHSSLPLTKLMFPVNDLFDGIPPFDRLPSYRLFKNSKDDSKSGVSGKMSRQTAPFLWFYLMSITDKPDNYDPIVQSSLQFDVFNGFLCKNIDYSEELVRPWQIGLGRSISSLLGISCALHLMFIFQLSYTATCDMWLIMS